MNDPRKALAMALHGGGGSGFGSGGNNYSNGGGSTNGVPRHVPMASTNGVPRHVPMASTKANAKSKSDSKLSMLFNGGDKKKVVTPAPQENKITVSLSTI